MQDVKKQMYPQYNCKSFELTCNDYTTIHNQFKLEGTKIEPHIGIYMKISKIYAAKRARLNYFS